MRVLRKCIIDIKYREIEELKKLVDNQGVDKKDPNIIEDTVVDPIQIAAMVVKDNNLFQEPKKPPENNGEKEGFQLEFNLREQQHLKAQMQAFQNIAPPAYDEEAAEYQKEEK